MKANSKQGFVLLSVLFFLLIVLLACLSSLTNITLASYGQGAFLKNHKNFYQIENQMNILEQDFIDKQYYLKDLKNILARSDIHDLSKTPIPNLDSNNTLPTFVISERDHEGLQGSDNYYYIAYLGMREYEFTNPFIPPDSLHKNTWLFRVRIMLPQNQNYYFESILEVFPEEVKSSLAADQGKPIEFFKTQRIAWTENLWEE